jgi:hypothetical protein
VELGRSDALGGDPIVEPLDDEPIVLAGPGAFCVDPAGADSGVLPAE